MNEWLIEKVAIPVLLLVSVGCTIGGFVGMLQAGPVGWLTIGLVTIAICWR